MKIHTLLDAAYNPHLFSEGFKKGIWAVDNYLK